MVVLDVESFLLSTPLVVRVQGHYVVHATLVRYNRQVGRTLWAAAAPIHRRLIPYLLDHAARGTNDT
jgi:hypothetical protein